MSDISDEESDIYASSGSEFNCESSNIDSDSSSSSMGRGCRNKKRKRHDDSLAFELENKVRAKSKGKAPGSSKRGKKSKKKEEFVPVRIQKVEDRLKASSSGTQKIVAIAQAKQLAAIAAKRPVSRDMMVVEVADAALTLPEKPGPSVSQEASATVIEPSPDKQYYKNKLAELLRLQQSGGTSSKFESCGIKGSAKAINVSEQTITASLGKSSTLQEKQTNNWDDILNPVSSLDGSADDNVRSGVSEDNHRQDSADNNNKSDAEGEGPTGSDDVPKNEEEKMDPIEYKDIIPEQQLLFPKKDHGIKRLFKGFDIFVKKSTLNILESSTKHTALARGLLEAVFTQEALYHCSLKGKVAKGPFGKPAKQRSALHPDGVAAILKYCEDFCERKRIELKDEVYIRKQLGTRQSEIRNDMRKSFKQ